MTDIHTRFVIETVNSKLIDFIVNSDLKVSDFYKTLNREELYIYANESKRLGDLDTFEKLSLLINNSKYADNKEANT